ncbi:MAG: hypothetical protein LBC61_07475 [Candidatus Peribacteria bacterium]|nr:hypothetical protein [Candidatus Peribacteria bacterium]
MIAESKSKEEARAILKQIFAKFSVFKSYPSNEFQLIFKENFNSNFLEK